MYPLSLFSAKIINILKLSSENEHFYSREVLLCFRNVIQNGYSIRMGT